MAVVKLKQTDIEKIVKTIVNEQYWTEEELPVDDSSDDTDNQSGGPELTMMRDPNGKFYAVDMSNPKSPRIVASTK